MVPMETTAGEIAVGEGATQVRAGFRVVDASALAGGPIEIAFFVEKDRSPALYVMVAGDRARQRPGSFSFAATVQGARLLDPKEGVPDLGGPATAVAVEPGRPWCQPLLLNEFVRLEDASAALAPGATGRLDVVCSRVLPLASDASAALLAREGPRVEVSLSLPLRRDDEALGALAIQLAAQVREGPPAERERPLARLLAMRSAARPQLESLVDAPDPSVAMRVRAVLAVLR
jgi:hypothetical protein